MKLKKRYLYNLSLYIVIFAMYSMISTSCGKCSKPSDNLVDMTIPIDLINSSSSPGACEMFSQRLLSDFKSKGSDAFAKTALFNKGKWIIEFHLAGDCGSNTVWKELYKKGDWDPEIKTINGTEFFCCKLKGLPSGSTVSADISISSPCIESPCHKRSRFPKAVRLVGVFAGTTPPEQIKFNDQTDCN